MRKKDRRHGISLYPRGADPRAAASQVAAGAIASSLFAVFAVAMAIILFVIPHGEYTAFLSRPWRFDPAGFYALLAAAIAGVLCFGFVRVSRIAPCVSLVGVSALTIFLIGKEARPQLWGWSGCCLLVRLSEPEGSFVCTSCA
jgi:hypothetical protein